MTLEEIANDKNLQGAIEQIKELNKKVGEYSAKAKPIDGADAFEKRLNELEEDITRGLKHTIATLASEVDHGNSAIAEYQDSLETARRDIKSAAHGNRGSVASFLSRFVDSIRKRDQILGEALRAFKKRLELDDSTQSPKTIVQVLQQQHEAIVRSAARVEQLRERMGQVKRRAIDFLRSRRIHTNMIENVDEGDQKGSVLATVNDNYGQFLADRKRDLDKRHTNPEQFKTPPQQSGFSFGSGMFSGFGQNK
jgi:chromosome segregation ATPase